MMLLVKEEYERRCKVPVENPKISFNWGVVDRGALLAESLDKEPDFLRESMRALDEDNLRPRYKEGMVVKLGGEFWIITFRFLDTKRNLIRYSLVREKGSEIVNFHEADLMACDEIHGETVKAHYYKEHLNRSLEDIAELKENYSG